MVAWWQVGYRLVTRLYILTCLIVVKVVSRGNVYEGNIPQHVLSYSRLRVICGRELDNYLEDATTRTEVVIYYV